MLDSLGLGDNFLCITKPNGFQLLSEQVVHIAGSKGDIFASQIGANRILIENSSKKVDRLYIINVIQDR